ncbi:GFA family protein [Tropicibacter sp. S64]|uniref:GFA family protein n=1 Tax=Tropicibacter sp. S64 TaxID=3415122 RepID=UPI003C7EC276
MIEGRCLCGAVHWTYDGVPEDATACNCTACRRYGTLWAYDWEGGVIALSGPVKAFARPVEHPALDFLFCETCGCVAAWRGRKAQDNGHLPIAVNLRLAEPEAVAGIRMLRFDGLDTFEDVDPLGRSVGDMWY